jgi:hypothetical protein
MHTDGIGKAHVRKKKYVKDNFLEKSVILVAHLLFLKG